MNDSSADIDALLRRAAEGDSQAADALFARYRERLKRMLRLRMNPRLQQRVDESDVLQDTFLEAARGLENYLENPPLPFFLWLRQIAGRKLIDVHRRHMDARARDAGQEISLHSGPMPAASSASLAARLLGRMSSPSEAAVKAELRVRVQEALNRMEPTDREVLALRHFEQLSNAEAAQVLGIGESACSSRYVRALERVGRVLKERSGRL